MVKEVDKELKSTNIYLLVRIFIILILYFTGINKIFADGVDLVTLLPTYVLFFLPISIEYWLSIKPFTKIGHIVRKTGRIVCPAFLVILFIALYGGCGTINLYYKPIEVIFRYCPSITIFLSFLDYFFSLNPNSREYNKAIEVLKIIFDNKNIDILKLSKAQIKNEIDNAIRG